MKEIWIGDSFVRNIRNVTLFDTETHEKVFFVTLESEAIKLAKMINAIVKYSDDYNEKEIDEEVEKIDPINKYAC